MILGYLSSLPVMARTNRRKHFVMSAVFMGASMAALGICLSLREVRKGTGSLFHYPL